VSAGGIVDKQLSRFTVQEQAVEANQPGIEHVLDILRGGRELTLSGDGHWFRDLESEWSP
jgi:hypothetical protein